MEKNYAENEYILSNSFWNVFASNPKPTRLTQKQKNDTFQPYSSVNFRIDDYWYKE